MKIVTLTTLGPSLSACGAAVGYPSQRAARSAGDYKLRFFTEEENALLDKLMEMIIPADNHSPGAHAAQVSLFADLMVATSDKGTQRQWREGRRLIREQAAKSSLAEALAKSSFIGRLKSMTVNGYYTSAIGIHQDLQYQGSKYLSAFPGFTIKKVMMSDE
jgi:Gluconate 2-dehydrogenase subunit 3